MILLLLFYFGACLASSIHGQKLHEHMTKEEIELVFKVNHDDVHKLEYEVVPVFHKNEVLQSANPSIHLRAFNKNYSLYLEKNDHILLGANTPLYLAKGSNKRRSGDGQQIVYSKMTYPLPESFKLYHDLENRAAVTLHTDDDDKVHVHGTVGDDIIIRSLPPRVHKEVLNEQSNYFNRFSNIPFIDDNNDYGSSSSYQSTHHVIIKPSQQGYVPFTNSISDQWYQFAQQPINSLNQFQNWGYNSVYNRPGLKPANKPVHWKLWHTTSTTEEPFTWHPVTKEPYTWRPVTKEPYTWRPVTKEPYTWRPVTKEPYTWRPVTKEPYTWRPVTKEPYTWRPVTKPTTQKPLSYHPTTAAPHIVKPAAASPVASEDRSGNTVYPELLVVVDYETYTTHGSDVKEVAKYIAAFWNAVDLRFREINSPNVRLNIAGLIIPTQPDGTAYMDRFRQGPKTVLAAKTLTSVGEYFAKDTHFPKDKYDIVVAISHRNLGDIATDGKLQDGITGIATFEGACLVKQGYSAALVRDKGGFNGITTAAHELAHTLGAPHDGDESRVVPGGPCRWSDGFLMSYERKDSKGMHWSKCSKTALHLFLKSEKAQCLKNKPNTGTPYPKLLPGQILSRDEQCQRSMGLVSYKEKEFDCAVLYCAKYMERQISIQTEYRPPAEGSYCGEGKICLDAQCVENPGL